MIDRATQRTVAGDMIRKAGQVLPFPAFMHSDNSIKGFQPKGPLSLEYGKEQNITYYLIISISIMSIKWTDNYP